MNYIKEIRLKNKLTQEELAERVGLTTSTVGMYETGARNPSYYTLIKLSEVLGVSIDTIVKGYNGNWISCTPHDITNGIGRLPSLEDCKSYDYYSNEKFGSFMVTTVSGYTMNDRGVSQACFRIRGDKSFWYRDGGDMKEKDNIIAWQPLPESYKGELIDYKLE